MPISQITPKDAQTRLQAGEDTLYLDVRSEPEFAAGHAPGAINIPLMHMDPATRRMSPNGDFLRVAQANLRADRNLVVGCAAGGRSQKACEILAGAGYANLANIRGGFLGMRDPMGRVLEPGWTQEGLPVTQDLPEASVYSTLKNR